MERSQVVTKTPTHYLHFKAQPQSSFEHALPNDWNAFVYMLDGNIKFFLILTSFCIVFMLCCKRIGSEDNNQEVKPHEVAFLSKNDDQNIVRIFNDGDVVAEFVLIAREPTNEPVKQHGPMVMNTEEELIQAFRFVV